MASCDVGSNISTAQPEADAREAVADDEEAGGVDGVVAAVVPRAVGLAAVVPLRHAPHGCGARVRRVARGRGAGVIV
jgi:hypothetical protein